MMRVFAQELRIILPALFKVDATCCKVALFGSTPKVSEKSLECIPRQQIRFQTRVVNKRGGRKETGKVAHLLAMSMIINGRRKESLRIVIMFE